MRRAYQRQVKHVLSGQVAGSEKSLQALFPSTSFSYRTNTTCKETYVGFNGRSSKSILQCATSEVAVTGQSGTTYTFRPHSIGYLSHPLLVPADGLTESWIGHNSGMPFHKRPFDGVHALMPWNTRVLEKLVEHSKITIEPDQFDITTAPTLVRKMNWKNQSRLLGRLRFIFNLNTVDGALLQDLQAATAKPLDQRNTRIREIFGPKKYKFQLQTIELEFIEQTLATTLGGQIWTELLKAHLPQINVQAEGAQITEAIKTQVKDLRSGEKYQFWLKNYRHWAPFIMEVKHQHLVLIGVNSSLTE